MKKKHRFSIRAKLALTSMISIALAVLSLGIFLLTTFTNSAYQSASNTLSSVSTNATLALENSITSADTSMKLLTNQIGYNPDFANNIMNANNNAARKKITEALSGENDTGDGSTIIGVIDYLVKTDPDIESATMYSPYVVTPILDRLKPVEDSKISYVENYKKLTDHPGKSIWFFTDDNQLYVWKALVNFGVEDPLDMQVVGYMEYGFKRSGFLGAITDTQYENEGMILLDENQKVVLSLGSSYKKVDQKFLNDYKNLKEGTKRYSSYTASKHVISSEGWTYITYINHRSIEKTINQGRMITILIVTISVIVSAFIAYLFVAGDIKRIKNLSTAAKTISQGNYDVSLKTTKNDEITDVSESFNTMAVKIQDVLNELIEQQDSISENFATILSNKSGESGNHVKRVSEYSAILASELGFNKDEVHDIRIASMLHDVGKIMIDESILHKPGRFTDEERKIMEQHVVYGGQLLKGVPGNIMQLGAIIAEHHHERYDGNGYCKHLKGDEIPKEAQITSVADVFDALVSRRCYKGAWTIEEAYNEIVSQSGKQFAPDVVEAFQRRFEDFKRISEIYKEEE